MKNSRMGAVRRPTVLWAFVLVVLSAAGSVRALALSVDVTAASQVIQSGKSTTIRWTSSGAKWCWSNGGFRGGRPLQGSYDTGPLASKTWFGVTCSNGKQKVKDGVTITVRDDGDGSGDDGSGGEVAVELSASPSQIRRGESATLSWSSENADSCTAGGAGWSGSRPLSGSTGTGALTESTLYRLTCQRGQQTAVSSVTVQVGEVPLVRWRAPTRNVDGTSLDDLAGYWLYWGNRSRNYSGRVRVANPGLTQYRPDQLASGSYFVAVTAFNRDGEESGYSNEIQIEVP